MRYAKNVNGAKDKAIERNMKWAQSNPEKVKAIRERYLAKQYG